MNPDPRALLAGLERLGVRVVRLGERRIAVGPNAAERISEVDRVAIRWAKGALLEALRRKS